MKRIIFIIVLIVALFTITWIGLEMMDQEKMIKEGEVVELVCEEGYTRNIGVSTPNIIVIPTKYFVIIKNDYEEIKVEINKYKYEKLQIGDWFIIN